ncbi:hypothetical protein LCGC14_3091780 [marine sediment metagenome]|uniref:Uncharacterized protein n=1 Tax=marine sediment metagenome TaxID=412755 RepID=A0A0F8WZ31_9ZZZZ
MPIFKCDDVECKGYALEELIPHVKFIWNEKTGKLEADEAICLFCGNQRKVVGNSGPIKIPWFKSENAKNHNNKTIKKYDYDHEAANSTTIELP